MKKYVLSGYLARLFALYSLAFAFIFSFIIVLFNTIELLRRTHNRGHILLKDILPLSLMELPHLLDQLTPFILLFTTMFLLWKLARKSELISLQASGFSSWSILNPLGICAFFYGCIYLGLFNPLITSLYKEADRQTAKVFGQSRDLSTISKTGIWIKHLDDDQGTYSIIHVGSIENNDTFQDVTIYNFTEDSDFLNRIRCARAIHTPNGWTLKNAYLSEHDDLRHEVGDYLWKTNITLDRLQKSFESPHSMSVWELPTFINLMENSGFMNSEYKLQWYFLLLKPFLFLSMIFVGGITLFQNLRRQNGVVLIGLGIAIGFSVYFLHTVFYSLGKSGSLPPWIAALAPAAIAILTSIALLLHFEEKVK